MKCVLETNRKFYRNITEEGIEEIIEEKDYRNFIEENFIIIITKRSQKIHRVKM